MQSELKNISSGKVHPNIRFVNLEEDYWLNDGVFHRVMKLETALSIFQLPHSLSYSSPMVWTDPFEHFPFQHLGYCGKTECQNYLKENVFAACMTDRQLFEAHWKAYTNSEIAIEFQFRKDQYLNQLDNLTDKYHVYVGMVDYLPDEDILARIKTNSEFDKGLESRNFDWFADLLFLKRPDFAYEREIRIVLIRKFEPQNSSGQPVKQFVKEKYDCKDQHLIKRIILGPSTPDNTTLLLLDVFRNQYGFKGLIDDGPNAQEKVSKSSLYRELGEPDSKKLISDENYSEYSSAIGLS